MDLCIYPGIKVQVEGLEGERISQMCGCRGSQRWCGGNRQNHKVLVRQRQRRCYDVVNWPLPWQLQRLFKIMLQNVDGAFVEYLLALDLTTVPESSGNLDPV